MPEKNVSVISRGRAARYLLALMIFAAALSAVIYLRGIPGNPPGFFVDESSIAYNAHTIARAGTDEHGARWPLYFRAFGEYKSPVYIYLLAAVFKTTGPSITAARMLSAVAGLLAAILMGCLAARATKSYLTGATLAATAMLTPWLFELSRLVFEVALMPLLLALFLLLLHAASERDEQWSWPRAAAIGGLLGLMTYTYSAGRLLAPLLAFGLLLFATRGRWRGVLRAWLSYGATLAPLFVFTSRHPGALGARFADVTFIKPEFTPAQIAVGFIKNYAGSFSLWSWLVTGDPEPRHHLPLMGSLLAATAVLGIIGIVVALLRHRRDAWWRFVLYGLAASAVPSSLTLDHFHTLRLVALPVFLLLLSALAIGWLLGEGEPRSAARWRPAAFAVLVLLTLAQGAVFQWQFQKAAERRWHSFDAHYPEVFTAATSLPRRPIYLLDAHAAPGYIHAYWYATLRGIDRGQFIRLPQGAAPQQPPTGALVISTELPCTNCRIIREGGPFRAYIAL